MADLGDVPRAASDVRMSAPSEVVLIAVALGVNDIVVLLSL